MDAAADLPKQVVAKLKKLFTASCREAGIGMRKAKQIAPAMCQSENFRHGKRALKDLGLKKRGGRRKTTCARTVDWIECGS